MKTTKQRLFKQGDIIKRKNGDYEYIVCCGTTPDYVVYESYPRRGADGGIPMDKALAEFELVEPRESRKQMRERIKELVTENAGLNAKLVVYEINELAERDKTIDELREQLKQAVDDKVTLQEINGELRQQTERQKHFYELAVERLGTIDELREQLAAAQDAVCIVEALEMMPSVRMLVKNKDGKYSMVPNMQMVADIYTWQSLKETLQIVGLLKDGE